MGTLPYTDILLQILLSLGIIIVATKYIGIVVQKIGFPQVAGEIIAGLLLKLLPFFSNFGGTDPNIVYDLSNKFISFTAEIGVVLIMFSAGLSTNLKTLIKSGVKSTVIAASGVLIPLAMGTLTSCLFFKSFDIHSPTFYKALFIGTILTATSVSITVAALKELGKLSTFTGQTIVSSAIIDDVFGIIVLTIVIGLASGGISLLQVLLKVFAFFIFSLVVGYIVYKLFKWYDRRHPHSHRIAIYGFGVALIMAYCAEKFFGIADITGAYIAGVIFCPLHDAQYIENKIDINSYMFFSPLFFASIGLKTSFATFSPSLFLFMLLFVIIGCASKVLGCGASARLLGFTPRESIQIGVGMMVRGEVALIVTQKGLSSGIISSEYFAPVILLIILSSVITPLLLKLLFKEKQA